MSPLPNHTHLAQGVKLKHSEQSKLKRKASLPRGTAELTWQWTDCEGTSYPDKHKHPTLTNHQRQLQD